MNTSFERKAQKDEWLTPKFIINALAPFGLDPCASEIRPWSIATNHYTRKNNGLLKSWTDLPVPLVNHAKPFVWLNPPYGNQTQRWFRRMAEHNHGIALTFARTETRMFFESVWPKASAVLFLEGRLSFCDTTGKAGGSAGAPSVLIAYGEEARQRLKDCKLEGKFIEL